VFGEGDEEDGQEVKVHNKPHTIFCIDVCMMYILDYLDLNTYFQDWLEYQGEWMFVPQSWCRKGNEILAFHNTNYIMLLCLDDVLFMLLISIYFQDWWGCRSEMEACTSIV